MALPPYQVTPPIIVPQRGRPKKLRHKTAGEQFKRKMRVLTQTDENDKRRQFSVCKAVGYNSKNCPMHRRFKNKHQEAPSKDDRAVIGL